MPFLLAILPSNQFPSTRRVRVTNSPLFKESSMPDWAWKLYLARAWPSDGRLDGVRAPSRLTIWNGVTFGRGYQLMRVLLQYYNNLINIFLFSFFFVCLFFISDQEKLIHLLASFFRYV